MLSPAMQTAAHLDIHSHVAAGAMVTREVTMRVEMRLKADTRLLAQQALESA